MPRMISTERIEQLTAQVDGAGARLRTVATVCRPATEYGHSPACERYAVSSRHKNCKVMAIHVIGDAGLYDLYISSGEQLIVRVYRSVAESSLISPVAIR